MFDNLNGWEIIALLLLALFIFGPERLPKVIGDGLRMVRHLRDMARNATNDLSRELGTEVRLEDLNPKTFIRRHLLSEEEQASLRRPFDDAYRDVRQIAADTTDYRPGRSQPELPAGSGAGQRPSLPAKGAGQPAMGAPQGTPGYRQSGYERPGYERPGYEQPGYEQPGYEQPGYGPSPPGYDVEAT